MQLFPFVFLRDEDLPCDDTYSDSDSEEWEGSVQSTDINDTDSFEVEEWDIKPVLPQLTKYSFSGC